MASPSLYNTSRLVRLVQSVTDCWTSCIKKGVAPAKTTTSTAVTAQACKSTKIKIKSFSTIGHTVGHRRTLARDLRRNDDIYSLLNRLDAHVQRGHVSLCTVATKDSLFLQHDLHLAGDVRHPGATHDILDLTTALLIRLHHLSDSDRVPFLGSYVKCGGPEREKIIANIEHLLRCLRQTALERIIEQYLDLIGYHVLRWHEYWQYQKRIDEGWFAEWPNGQRPLSTTWPWNIKPSLLVLWGVCWMFYAPPGTHTSNLDELRTTRNRRGAVQQAELSGDFRTRQLGSLSQSLSQAPHPDHSDAWAGSIPITYPNYSWPHPHQAGVGGRRASATPAQSQAVNPTYHANLPLNPYITATSNESSDLLATSSIQWPYCRGINPGPVPAYAPSYIPWQSAYNQNDTITGSLTATPSIIDSQTPIQSYAPQRQATTNSQAGIGGVGSLGLGLGLHMQDMQDYPSPHSNVSDQTNSSCLSVLPGAMMSPGRRVIPSPSIVPSLGGSSNSRQSSRKSTEPPRNLQGVLYCSHPDCARQPPVFTRKCEWTKHMDKHNRPYICEEPECDNIRGFTYSGGLLRHQREVHRQHGGPKATCMCPHKDCKRSTGVGFSRKENLNEHLRRCHQPQRDSQPQTPASQQHVSSRPRKRRRNIDDDEDDDVADEQIREDDDDDGLRREVKKLRRELTEKDERLRRLERAMEVLTRGQGTLK